MLFYKHKNFKKYAGIALLILFGPLFIMLTNPDHLPLPLLVIPFVWLFVTLFTLCWLLLVKLGQSRRRKVIVSGAVSALPVLLLVFGSIHELSVKDVLIVFVLLGAFSFYLSKADFI